MDRKDLALQLRANLGDWFKVVNLLQQGGGDDGMLRQSWNQIGDYYMEHQMIAKAAQHYTQAKNNEKLIECYAVLEDYEALEKIIPELPEGSPLLTLIGKKFMAVGMSAEAVSAYTRSGNLEGAIDQCVSQHQWEAALTLAETHAYPDLQKILSQYAHPPSSPPLVCPPPLTAPWCHVAGTPRCSLSRTSSCMPSSSTARPTSSRTPPSC